MANRKPHRGSRRHFDNSSDSVEVSIIPVPNLERPGHNDVIEIDAPYHPDFVSGIKRIPSQDRYWEPKRKIWGVAIKYQPILIALIGQTWKGKAQINFIESESHPHAILAKQRAMVNDAVEGFRDDNLDSMRLT